ncbi:MAG: hypothetical protein L6R42_004104 [Xanthoria sp. 1 TBL-2021]|nr:MAG: hypothetical protein L6R42_004104 [Xanthoria sp. 1 TBL-2021]
MQAQIAALSLPTTPNLAPKATQEPEKSALAAECIENISLTPYMAHSAPASLSTGINPPPSPPATPFPAPTTHGKPPIPAQPIEKPLSPPATPPPAFVSPTKHNSPANRAIPHEKSYVPPHKRERVRSYMTIQDLFIKNPTPLPAATQFIPDIQIADVNSKYILAVASLDTACHAGNWISRHLVERLGRQREVSQDYDPPNLTDAGGHEVVACGIITLQWKWSPQGTRVHVDDFYIFRESPDLDVVFGMHFILSEGLLTLNEKVMIPMTAHNRATSAEKATIALALEKQKQDKAALEARRIQLQQQAGQQQGGLLSQAQQSGLQGPTQNQGRQRP